MIDRRGLLRALGNHGLADWVLLERAQEAGSYDDRTRIKRTEKRTLWQVTVHHDSPSGRGSAHVVIDAIDGSADTAVERVVTLARSSIGPAWVTRPLAAPAKMKLADESIAKRPLADVAQEIGRNGTASVLRENVHVVARQGLRTEWTATLFHAETVVAAGERSFAITRDARTRDGLELDAAMRGATEDLKLLASAGSFTPGPCALVLHADAMLHGELGVWQAFAGQADAVVERQGLTRYREQKPIAQGADHVPEPLSITSDGAMDFGVRSAPIGDEGGAVRRFALVERGIAAGLGLSPREGALRGRDPNGGVRNLEVAAGTWSGTVDAKARTVDVRRLRGLAIDPYTGEASLEIALGLDRGKPFTGGSLRLDLIDALAHARRSATTITRGPYRGPRSVLIEHAELIG